MVDQLRAQLEAQGFRYHRMPLKLSGRRKSWRFRPVNPDEPQPAYKVERLIQDEMRTLRHAGLTDEQIDAVSLIGMGTDEVHELMLQGVRSSRTKRTSR